MMKLTEKSLKWIKNHINNQEFIDLPIEAYYKAPIALYLGGESIDAQRILSKMKNTVDLYHYSDKHTVGRKCDNYYNYWLFLYQYFAKDPNKKEIYEIIKESFSEKTGGFTSIKNAEVYELRATAFGGICAFLMKDYQVGKSTADFIVNLFKKNEFIGDHFYLIQDENNELITNYSEENQRFYNYYVKNSKPLYYSVSLAIVNLCLAYMASGDEIYIECAKEYYDILIKSGKEAIFNNYIGKFGIASVLLYINTKDELYGDYYKRVNEYLAQTQKEFGFWEDSASNLTLALDRTSEFTASIYIMNYLTSQFSNYNSIKSESYMVASN